MEEKIKMEKKQKKGITLVALAITVIVLLILAGITINLMIGQEGIINLAQQAGQNHINAQEKENDILHSYNNKINAYIASSNRELENEKEIKFYNGNNGFKVTHGKMEFNSYGLKTTTFPTDNVVGGWYVSECEKIESGNLGNKFEISTQVYFNNETTSNMGGIEIQLLKNEETKVWIAISDAWNKENSISIYGEIGSKLIGNVIKGRYNGSGRYAIVGDGQKVYLYFGEQLLGSIDYTENIAYDKIVINIRQCVGYSMAPIYVESLYVGEPLYYKSLI